MGEADKLAEAMNADPNPSASKKKRAKEARKLETKVKLALEEGRIEEDIKGVKMEKVFSKASTKQAMIARVSLSCSTLEHCAHPIVLATSRTRTALKPLSALWPVRVQEQRPYTVPRDT